jgi:hypothetical protein
MSEIKTPPATDAYRDGWERVFGDSGEAPVRALEIGFEGAPECLGDGIGRFPRGLEGPLGFVLPSVVMGGHGGR